MIKFQDGKHDGKELQESFGQEIVSTSKRSQEHTIRISPSAAPLNLENVKTFLLT